MKILQTTLVAILISGFGASAQSMQTNSPKEVAAASSTPMKTELQSAYKAYQSATSKGEEAAYDTFLNLMYPVLSAKKASLVDAGTAGDRAGYEAIVNSFNNLIVVKRENDKTKILASMQKFIDLVKN